jgi:hypothetical protein
MFIRRRPKYLLGAMLIGVCFCVLVYFRHLMSLQYDFLAESISSPSNSFKIEKWFYTLSNITTIDLVRSADLFGSRVTLVSVSPDYDGKYGYLDHLLVAWDGDGHVSLGWPVGVAPLTGPARVGSISIDYVNFESDLASRPFEPRLAETGECQGSCRSYFVIDLLYSRPPAPASWG